MAMNWTSSRGDAVITGFAGRPPRKRFIETVRVWMKRARSRRELTQLSYLELKDLPDQEKIDAEKRKSFWQA